MPGSFILTRMTVKAKKIEYNTLHHGLTRSNAKHIGLQYAVIAYHVNPHPVDDTLLMLLALTIKTKRPPST